MIRAVMLAAGIGRRLQMPEAPPKVLLRFGGETLLARHLRLLAHCGVTELHLAVGYRAADIRAELARLARPLLVVTHENPDYRDGPMVSLWTLRRVLRAGGPVIFMDADVLYDHRLLLPLTTGDAGNRFLVDRTRRPGGDPVKVCLDRGHIVDFHKWPTRPHQQWGEWIGFAGFDAGTAARIADAAERYVARGPRDAIYELAFREVLLAAAPGAFEVADVTGLPWTEIDEPEDLARAHREVFPRLVAPPRPAAQAKAG